MRHVRPGAVAEARAPIPTLADEDIPNTTDTLRPAGAMPPPPRGVPRPGAFMPSAAALERADATATPIPGIRVRPSSPLLTAPTQQSAEAPVEKPVQRDASPPASPEQRVSVPSMAPPLAPNLPTSIGAATSSMLPGHVENVSLGLRVALGFLSALCVLLALSLVFALYALSSEPRVAASATPTPSASAKPRERTPSPAGCVLRAPAAKLYSSVERSIEPRFLDLNTERVAIGFAATRSQAAGIVVELGQLDSNAVFDEARERPVLGVTPVSAEPLTFSADRDDGVLTSPHSLDVTPRTVLGFTGDGLAKRVEGRTPELIWPLAREASTEPRVVHASPQAYALALRQGGLTGTILSGWLDADLKPASELLPVAAGAKWVGSPALAARGDALLLAFASRDSEGEAWRIRLGKAEAKKPVTSVVVHSTPNEGLGNGAIAPTLAALGNDHWVLQWTQGSAGQYRVYVQELGPDLRPVGAPVAASPKGASAGLGAVRVRGDSALSVFVLTVGGRDELWGASLQCH